jgi:hypothetical protein
LLAQAGAPIDIPFPFGASLCQRSSLLFSGISPETWPSKIKVSLKQIGYENEQREKEHV